MPTPETHPDLTDRLLAAAAAVVAKCPFCWLTSAAAGVESRPMGPIARNLDPEGWSFSFVTDGRSRKVQSLRRSRDVSLIFQREGEEAYVGLIGKIELVEEPSEVARRWKSAYDPYFPTEEDRRAAIFLDIHIDQMNLWIRGATPEPFGSQTTTLARDGKGPWRLV
jgi:general stress protein 26